ncbi:MAG: hypothetical protein ACLT98_07750 [Eggerthellaceae bacterium]
MAAETKEFRAISPTSIIDDNISIVNAAIFFGMNASNPDVTFAAGKVVERSSYRRPAEPHLTWWCSAHQDGPAQERLQGQPIATASSPLPGGAITLSIPVGIIAAALAGALALAFTMFLPLPLTRTGMMIFKGCMCAVVGALSGYIVMTRTTAGFEPESK